MPVLVILNLAFSRISPMVLGYRTFRGKVLENQAQLCTRSLLRGMKDRNICKKTHPAFNYPSTYIKPGSHG